MKNKINSTLHDKSKLNKTSGEGNEARGQRLKLGLDVDLRNITVAIQCEGGAIGAWLDEKRGNIPDVEWSDSHQDTDATVNITQQASLSKRDALRLRQEQYLQPQRGTLRTAGSRLPVLSLMG
jgi:hypothetical protein